MLTCLLCDSTVARHGLKRHMATHNPDTMALPCPYAHIGCTLTFRQPVNLRTHVEAKHTMRKWRCAHCPQVLSSQSALIRHCQRMHSEHGYTKQRRGDKRRSSTSSSSSSRSSSTSSIHSPTPASPIEEMKFDDIVMNTTYFVDTMNALEVQPLTVAFDTSLLLKTTSMGDFGWQSNDYLTWTIPDDPLAYITGVNLPNFDFDAELRRVQAELFAQFPPSGDSSMSSTSSYSPSSASSYSPSPASSPPSSTHCGLHFAPPSPSTQSHECHHNEHTQPVFYRPLPWNFDPASSFSAVVYSELS